MSLLFDRRFGTNPGGLQHLSTAGTKPKGAIHINLCTALAVLYELYHCTGKCSAAALTGLRAVSQKSEIVSARAVEPARHDAGCGSMDPVRANLEPIFGRRPRKLVLENLDRKSVVQGKSVD